MIQLYDLAGADERDRWSPYCWRAKLALAHKGLAFEAIPWRYHQKAIPATAKKGTVPVLVDGENLIDDSWQIALYLDQAYPDRPGLFGPAAGADPALALFVKHWTEQQLHPLLRKLTLLPMYKKLHPTDQPYFRASREAVMGVTLEQICQDRDETLSAFRQQLAPLRSLLRDQPFIGGAQATFADYIVLAMMYWLIVSCNISPLAPDDPLQNWFNSLSTVLDRAGLCCTKQ